MDTHFPRQLACARLVVVNIGADIGLDGGDSVALFVMVIHSITVRVDDAAELTLQVILVTGGVVLAVIADPEARGATEIIG